MTSKSYLITKKSCWQNFLVLAFIQGTLTYYTYSYTTIPSSLRSNSLVICFLVHLLLSYLQQLVRGINLFYLYQNIGLVTNEFLWRSVVPIYRYPWAILL